MTNISENRKSGMAPYIKKDFERSKVNSIQRKKNKLLTSDKDSLSKISSPNRDSANEVELSPASKLNEIVGEFAALVAEVDALVAEVEALDD